MPKVGLGKAPVKKGGSGKASGVRPSNKKKLIDGAIPRFKGPAQIDMGYEPPVTVTVYSLPGLGKTHCGFTFPNVACCDTEMKGEKVWKKFYKGEYEAYRLNKDGEVEPYTWDGSFSSPDDPKLFHAEDWGDVAAFYDHYVKDDDVETLMFDSETDLREFAELWTLKETGKSTLYGGEGGSAKVQYASVFGKLRYILDHAKRAGKNLFYTGKAKPEYDSLGNKTGAYVYDGYNKQFFFSGYVLYLQEGIQNEKGETIYKDHIFGRVDKCENMHPRYYPPYVVEPTYKGIMNELVRGEPWEGSLDEYIRKVVAPAMEDLDIKR